MLQSLLKKVVSITIVIHVTSCTSTFKSPPPFATVDKEVSPEAFEICHEDPNSRNILKTIPSALRGLPFLSEDILKAVLQKGLNFFSQKVWIRVHTLPSQKKNKASGSFIALSKFRIPLDIPTEFRGGERKGQRVLFNRLEFGAVPGKRKSGGSIQVKNLKLGQFYMEMPQVDSGKEEVILEKGYTLDLNKNEIKLDGKVYVSPKGTLKFAFCKLEVENSIELSGRACTGLSSFLCDWKKSDIKYRIERSLLKGLNSDDSQKRVKGLFF